MYCFWRSTSLGNRDEMVPRRGVSRATVRALTAEFLRDHELRVTRDWVHRAPARVDTLSSVEPVMQISRIPRSCGSIDAKAAKTSTNRTDRLPYLARPAPRQPSNLHPSSLELARSRAVSRATTAGTARGFTAAASVVCPELANRFPGFATDTPLEARGELGGIFLKGQAQPFGRDFHDANLAPHASILPRPVWPTQVYR
jgi:hypothetical protein